VAQSLKILHFKEVVGLQNHAETIKSTLFKIIGGMAGSSMLYAKNPEKDFTRMRKLPFDEMIKQLVLMGGNTLAKELMDSYGYDPNTVTSSAFIQQRAKILPLAFEFLLQNFTSSCTQIKKYNGYRLLAGDGSSLNISHDPLDADTYYRRNSDSKGYNLLHLNALYDLRSRVYVDAIVHSGIGNEHRGLIDMVDRSPINEKTIVALDRGFEGYNNMAHIERKGWHYVIRVKDITSCSGILCGLNLPSGGEFDVPISFVLTRKQTNAVKSQPNVYKGMHKTDRFDFLDLHQNKFYPFSFRVVRVMLPNGEYESLITNLSADDFPPETLKDIYKCRWGIETSFRELKYTIGMANFHAKKREFIVQEIFARLIMYNFVSVITVEVVIAQTGKQYAYKVNFTTAVIVCRRFLRLRNNEPPLDVEALLRKSITPIRPVRKGQTSTRSANSKAPFSFIYRIS
jgi:hypothetical protein